MRVAKGPIHHLSSGLLRGMLPCRAPLASAHPASSCAATRESLQSAAVLARFCPPIGAAARQLPMEAVVADLL
jgi:hypothetical protein